MNANQNGSFSFNSSCIVMSKDEEGSVLVDENKEDNKLVSSEDGKERRCGVRKRDDDEVLGKKKIKESAEKNLCVMKQLMSCENCGSIANLEDELSALISLRTCEHIYCGHCMLRMCDNNKGTQKFVKCVFCNEDKSTEMDNPSHIAMLIELRKRIELLEKLI